MRSFDDPPGLNISSLATRVHSKPMAVRSSRTIGVRPINPAKDSATSIGGPGSVTGRTSTPISVRESSGETSSSVKSSIGKPARRRPAATAAESASGPQTPIRRGILARSEPTRASSDSSSPSRCTWRDRSRSRAGGGAPPTTTRRSMPPLYHFHLPRRQGDGPVQELVQSSAPHDRGLITFRGFSLRIVDTQVRPSGTPCTERFHLSQPRVDPWRYTAPAPMKSIQPFWRRSSWPRMVDRRVRPSHEHSQLRHWDCHSTTSSTSWFLSPGSAAEPELLRSARVKP